MRESNPGYEMVCKAMCCGNGHLPLRVCAADGALFAFDRARRDRGRTVGTVRVGECGSRFFDRRGCDRKKDREAGSDDARMRGQLLSGHGAAGLSHRRYADACARAVADPADTRRSGFVISVVGKEEREEKES